MDNCERIQKAIDYIEENLTDKIELPPCVKEMAERCCAPESSK